MPLTLSQQERGALATAQQQSRNVRHGRRYQAVLLRAEGISVKQVAQSLGCTETSVYNWSAAYRQEGVAGDIWFADREMEPTLREFPPLRAGQAPCGAQAVVVVSGRNSRRVVHGALNAATGELVTLLRERLRQSGLLGARFNG